MNVKKDTMKIYNKIVYNVVLNANRVINHKIIVYYALKIEKILLIVNANKVMKKIKINNVKLKKMMIMKVRTYKNLMKTKKYLKNKKLCYKQLEKQ